MKMNRYEHYLSKHPQKRPPLPPGRVGARVLFRDVQPDETFTFPTRYDGQRFMRGREGYAIYIGGIMGGSEGAVHESTTCIIAAALL